MIKLKLIKPTMEYKEQILETVQEFFDNKSNICGVSQLQKYLDNYEGWLDFLKKGEKQETVDEGLVPSKQFLLVRKLDNKLIGFINARLKLNKTLLEHGGHIGYAIRPTERKKFFATAQLFAIFPIYENMGVEKLLITCDKTNVGSAKTIKKCGGILENEIIDPSDGELIQRYWVDVKQGIEKGKAFFENNGVDIEIK